ncbi:MAG: glycerol-3-phosphate acyltransferase [Bacteroidales bacterium]|nr:glycerol-3-phosphate acyltransferase [Bacteroidales bacterium]
MVYIICYLIGSIPFGLFFVKILSGKDLRKVESGRTGGTNALRAAGWTAGIMTAVMDIFKGYSSSLIVTWMGMENIWVRIFAALFVVIGHNYSAFLIEKKPGGGLKFRGGAGGASALGGAMALWPPSGLIILPLAVLVFYLFRYASITTISIGAFSILTFGLRAIIIGSEWQYIIYGVIAVLIVMWALRPNLQRLNEGTERIVGKQPLIIQKLRKNHH